MKIAVITDLYPEDEHETIKTTSFAIKELLEGVSIFDIDVEEVIIPKSLIQWSRLKLNQKSNSKQNHIDIRVKTFFRLPRGRFILTGKQLSALAHELREVDLIVSHLDSGAYISSQLYKKYRIPYIYILHNSDILNLKKNRELLLNAQGIYVRSWALRKKLESKNYIIDGVVFSGIEKSLIIKRDFQRKPIKLLSVHLLQALKNTDITLKALAALPKELNWEYTIIGDGEEYDNLKMLVGELRLKDRVSLLGYKDRDECIDFMKESDIFLMPSAPETFGLAYLEAMASGCIIVCAKDWGIDGLISNGANGYTVEARNKNQLVELLQNILTTDQSIIYENSFKTISGYTLEKAQKNYADIIKTSKSNKELYREFCEAEENVPFFSLDWWLDSVCGKENWDVALVKKDKQIMATLPYFMKKKSLFNLITMPLLTQKMGPYLKYPKNQKYYKRLSFEKEMADKLTAQLPNFDYFVQNFNENIVNILPYFWKKYNSGISYTYVISKKISLENVKENFQTDIRRRLKKADKLNICISESEDIDMLYSLNEMTFRRQNIDIPYSLEFVKNIYANCKKKSACKIYVASEQSKPIAAAFLVYDDNRVYYLIGGIDPHKRDLGGMDLVLYESIKFAIGSKRDFDFEGSTVESIEKYFRSFGSVQEAYCKVSKTNSKLLLIRQFIKDLLQ